MQCSLVAAWRSILQIKTQQAKRLPFTIIQKTQQKKCVLFNGSSYYTRKLYSPLCSIMKLHFLFNKMLAMTFCMHAKIIIATAATRAKIFSIVYICGQLFHT